MNDILSSAMAAKNSLNSSSGNADYKAASEIKLLCIWLVDNDDEYRQLQSELLNVQPEVKCVRHYPSAAAALVALNDEPAPDVILLDVEMPEMSGIEAIQPILKIAPDIHVMMFTTFSNKQRRDQAFAAGASGFLLKGITSTEIVTAILASFLS
jgi:DNA-binding NarL/FixJ family response regulator